MTTLPHINAPTKWLISLLDQLFRQSDGERYDVARTQFDSIILGIALKYLPAGWQDDCEGSTTFLKSLHVTELILARACAAGNGTAWNEFMTQFRPALYSAARSIARDESAGRELADALYADLYGMAVRDGERISKLNSYTGRGSLAGWLRTVLAQEHVNRYRKQRREVSLEEKVEAGAQFAAPLRASFAPPDIRVVHATDNALAALTSEERFILVTYYLDGATLAQVAAMLGVHESTVSRKIDRVVQQLTKHIRQELVRGGMSRRQAEEAMAVDVRDLAVDFGKMRDAHGAKPYPPATDSSKNRPQDLPARTFQAGEEEK